MYSQIPGYTNFGSDFGVTHESVIRDSFDNEPNFNFRSRILKVTIGSLVCMYYCSKGPESPDCFAGHKNRVLYVLF